MLPTPLNCYKCKLPIYDTPCSHNVSPDAASGGCFVWYHSSCLPKGHITSYLYPNIYIGKTLHLSLYERTVIQRDQVRLSQLDCRLCTEEDEEIIKRNILRYSEGNTITAKVNYLRSLNL
jgi:hypothetical protein